MIIASYTKYLENIVHYLNIQPFYLTGILFSLKINLYDVDLHLYTDMYIFTDIKYKKYKLR